MVSRVVASEHWRPGVAENQEEELREVDYVHELPAIASIKPHPVTVPSEALCLKSEQLHEAWTTSNPEIIVTLVAV